MADKEEKTKTYQVRLIKGFPMDRHRRAGFTFTPGPVPQELELTKDQKKLIEADPSLEFVSNSESKRVAESAKVLDESTGSPKASGAESTGGGRVYDDDQGGQGQPVNTDETSATGGAGDDGLSETAPSHDELVAMDRDALNQQAKTEGVKKPKKYGTPEELIAAIEDKRSKNTTE